MTTESLPRVYWPGSQDAKDPAKPKILTPCHPYELECLLRIGWKEYTEQ